MGNSVFNVSPQPAVHLDEQQRMAAQIEEVLLDADLVQPEHRLPDAGNGLLHFGLGRHVMLRLRADRLPE